MIQKIPFPRVKGEASGIKISVCSSNKYPIEKLVEELGNPDIQKETF